MNVISPVKSEGRYPVVANDLIDDPTPKDQAIYIPSVTPGYAMAAYAKKWARPLPSGVGDGDLNFLDPQNKLFRISHVMSSAGQALDQPHPCIVTERDRKHTLMIGDSGGYQIAMGRLKIEGDKDREKILRWLEQHADVAMTLDVPTYPVMNNRDYGFKTSKDCLSATLEHLEFFQKNRREGATRFLNVLQGNNTKESNVWYDAVKKYKFEGWAFAGVTRNNFYNLCRRIIIMADEGQLQDKSWIHVLGTNELGTAIGLTALQRAINKHINPNLRISFDTSSPFRNIRWRNVYTFPRFDRKKMTMPTETCPDGEAYVNSKLRWPWPSPIGDRMVMGDVCVPKADKFPSTYRDQQSNFYLANHNLAVLCSAMANANRIFDCTSVDHQHPIAVPVGAAVEAIEKCIACMEVGKVDDYRNVFAALRKEMTSNPEDDTDREF